MKDSSLMMIVLITKYNIDLTLHNLCCDRQDPIAKRIFEYFRTTTFDNLSNVDSIVNIRQI